MDADQMTLELAQDAPRRSMQRLVLPLRVLVACEYSGTVRDAFAASGHDAMSCDILPTDKPGKHYQGDVRDVWGGNYYALPCTRGWLMWRKPDAPPSMAHGELAWTNLDQNLKVIDWSIAATNPERVGHPTQKPVRVMGWTMEQAGVPDGATVFDPFMGSGSTAIACIRTGRKFIGVERDPAHYATALERIRREIEGDLFHSQHNEKLSD